MAGVSACCATLSLMKASIWCWVKPASRSTATVSRPHSSVSPPPAAVAGVRLSSGAGRGIPEHGDTRDCQHVSRVTCDELTRGEEGAPGLVVVVEPRLLLVQHRHHARVAPVCSHDVGMAT